MQVFQLFSRLIVHNVTSESITKPRPWTAWHFSVTAFSPYATGHTFDYDFEHLPTPHQQLILFHGSHGGLFKTLEGYAKLFVLMGLLLSCRSVGTQGRACHRDNWVTKHSTISGQALACIIQQVSPRPQWQLSTRS